MIVAALTLAVLAGGPGSAFAARQEAAPGDDNGPAETVAMVEYQIVTMPAVPGVRFTLDGVTRATGPDGIATFSVPRGTRDENVLIKDRVEVVDTEVEVSHEIHATFSKLVGAVSPLVAGFNLSYPVEFTFTDSSGGSVAPDRIDALRIKSSLGNVETIPPEEATWLLGTRLAGGLEVKNVFWSIQDVEVQGASVANRAQTKFFPETDRRIEAPLLFFDAHFNIIDAFFGFRTGTAILVEAPNGTTERIELIDGRASLAQVPRGEYHVTVEGGGLTIERPVAISRNQDLTLKLYTWLDVALVLMALALFVVVPPLVGVWLRRRHRRRDRGAVPVTPELQSQPVATVMRRGTAERITYARVPSTQHVYARNGRRHLRARIPLPVGAKRRSQGATVVRRGMAGRTTFVRVPSAQRGFAGKRRR